MGFREMEDWEIDRFLRDSKPIGAIPVIARPGSKHYSLVVDQEQLEPADPSPRASERKRPSGERVD